MIYLRAADRFDAHALAALRAASLVEQRMLPPAEASRFAIRANAEISTLLGADRLAAWIACDGDVVIGSSCVVFYDRLPYPDGSRHAELCGVYVMPEYRGRGFASELVRESVAVARAGGARKIFLRPSAYAKALYARLGFVETELMTFKDPHTSATEPALAALAAR